VKKQKSADLAALDLGDKKDEQARGNPRQPTVAKSLAVVRGVITRMPFSLLHESCEGSHSTARPAPTPRPSPGLDLPIMASVKLASFPNRMEHP
jgi:hypothetical protein